MNKRNILKITKEQYKTLQESVAKSKEKRKLVINESQFKFLENIIIESNNYDRNLKSVMNDLDLNYEPAVGTKEIGNEFFHEAAISKKVNGETITVPQLFEYLKHKYKGIEDDFLKQCVTDWGSGYYKEHGKLSKNIKP